MRKLLVLALVVMLAVSFTQVAAAKKEISLWFLRLFLSPRLSAILLLPLITLYFFFIGPAPSCHRAWITISLFLVSPIFSWRTYSLHILAFSLISALLINPLIITRLGFQLSYLITLSILLFYPLFEILLTPLLPPRPFQSLLKMSPLHQHGYILSSLTRMALSLNGAVHLLALPALLFLFGKFPLLSLVYNLFFPFCVGISLILLIVALGLSPLPLLSSGIHLINSAYTSTLTTIASHPPLFFHFFLRVDHIPIAALISYFTLLFWVGISLKENFAADKLTESPF